MRELLDPLLEAVQRQEAVAVATVIATAGEPGLSVGAKLLVHADGSLSGRFGDGPVAAGLAEAVARDALRLMPAGRLEVVRYQLPAEAAGGPAPTVEVALDVVLPRPTVVILGAGHIAVPLARICHLLGYRVVVIDDRPEYASPARFPDVESVVAADFGEALDRLRVTPTTCFVLVTRGHRYDYLCLRKLIWTEPAYIGMIGSVRRARAALEALAADGVPEERLQRIRTPIGIDIGADSPEEIAVAIAAEIIAVRRGGTARSMRASAAAGQPTGLAVASGSSRAPGGQPARRG